MGNSHDLPKEALDVYSRVVASANTIGGKHIIRVVTELKGNQQHKAKYAFHFCVDNSGSMGGNTRRSLECFSKLVDMATSPCSLVAFADRGVVLGRHYKDAAMLAKESLPSQGCTNITDGVARSLEVLTAQPDVHHILVLLSDGHHNTGPPPDVNIPIMGNRLRREHPNLKLSVIVVGITASSNTSMGMLARECLQTVPLSGLDPIYFASNPAQMTTVLDTLCDGMRGSLGGNVVRVRCPQGGVIEVPGEAPRKEVLVYGSGSFSVVVEGPLPRCLEIEGMEVEVVPTDFDEGTVVDALQRLVDTIRERRVASSSFDAAAAGRVLEPCLEELEKILAQNNKDGTGGAPVPAPVARVQKSKKEVLTVLTSARQLRNQLADIVAFKSNNSAEQAAFLTGSSAKYAGKAMRRALTADFSTLVENVVSRAALIRVALRDDLLTWLGRVPPERRGEVLAEVLKEHMETEELHALCHRPEDHLGCESSATQCLDDPKLAGCLLEAAQRVFAASRGVERPEHPSSWLSLQTQREQLAEWVKFAGDASEIRRAGVENEYQLLMYVGMVGYPITVRRWAATQMDPYQMEITKLRTAPVDTPTVCCALEGGQVALAPEDDEEVNDVLVLIDPDAPRASEAAFWSKLFDVHASVTCCRDLQMYSGVAMRTAQMAHALMSVLTPSAAPTAAPHAAQVEAALRICYSLRKVWTKAPTSASSFESLLQLLAGWEPLTAANGVMHTVQLVAALAALETDEECLEKCMSPPAALMLMNETLARKARSELRMRTSGHADVVRSAGVKQAIRYLGIRDDTAPMAQDVEVPEPRFEAVREGCSCEYELDGAGARWVDENVAPTLRAFGFAKRLREVLSRRTGGWPGLEADLEAGCHADVVEAVRDGTQLSLEAACDIDPRHAERTRAAMAAQAFVFNDGADRSTLPDVRDSETMREMAVDLRMEIYEARVHAKMAEWNKIAGSVTAARARVADIDQFIGMLGCHTHSLSKAVFWALWHAAKRAGDGGDKAREFLSKSNSYFVRKHGGPPS